MLSDTFYPKVANFAHQRWCQTTGTPSTRQTIQKTVPCMCKKTVNLRPEGNFQFEKFGFWCWPVDEKPKCIENAVFVMKKKEVCCSIVLYSSSRWSQKVFSAFSIPVAVSLSHQCHRGCKRTILGRQPAFFLVSGLLQGSSQSHSMFFQCQTQSSYYFCPTITKVLPLPIF